MLQRKARLYWKLIKSLQTGLLMITGLAGYMSADCPIFNLPTLFALTGSLFLSISGSTILNMVWDSDIDSLMRRTAKRPLPSGEVNRLEASVVGGLLGLLGVGWALLIDLNFSLLIAAGVFFDVIIYTVLLKRRTPYAILIGGLAGGMPALAGRTLAVGSIDLVGLLLMLGVLLWIPTHIMTFSIKYQQDYAQAGIPTFPSLCGVRATRQIVAASTILAVVVLYVAGRWTGLPTSLLTGLGVTGALLSGLVLLSLFESHARLNTVLYKGASVYMLASMLLIIASAW